MKYLLVIAVVLVAYWAWRNQRQSEDGNRPARTAAPRQPARMVACQLCGTHVPEGEQLTGRLGDYCCAAHRQQAEGPQA